MIPGEIVTIPVEKTAKTVTFCRVQDVEDILESNKVLRGQEQSRKSDFRHTHRVPNVFIEKILFDQFARGNVDLKWTDAEFWKIIDRELLQNSEYQDFRVDNPSNPFYLGWRTQMNERDYIASWRGEIKEGLKDGTLRSTEKGRVDLRSQPMSIEDHNEFRQSSKRDFGDRSAI